MKKTGLNALMVLVVAAFIFVNQNAQAQISYGLKGGLSMANIGGEGASSNHDVLSRFHVGGYLNVSLLGLIGGETGLYFSQKGIMVSDNAYTLNYIDVPILLRMGIFPFTSLVLGPQFSLFMSEGDNWENTNATYTSPDIAAVMGLSLNIPGPFHVSATYDLGLTPIDENSDTYNRVIKLSVGVKF